MSEGAEELRYFLLLGEGMNLQGVQQELAPTFANLLFILFLGFIVNFCTGLERCLISHRCVTLKQGFSPGSPMPWQWSPLHSPDLHRTNMTPLPHTLWRVHSSHRRRAVAVAMQKHPTYLTRDNQGPAPEREAAGPGCHWKQKADLLHLSVLYRIKSDRGEEKIMPTWNFCFFFSQETKKITHLSCPERS